MIPIAPTIFWGTMAYPIMGGLPVATVLTLVFLPALYVTWFRVKRPNADPKRVGEMIKGFSTTRRIPHSGTPWRRPCTSIRLS
jgi:hypothetical protein